MGFYLQDHPQRTPQHRYPRRVRTPGKPALSGGVAVHTVEGVMDTVGIDTGAENTASFIVNRADYGSYHEIHDSDSLVRMAPDDHETWHVGADAHNWHAWGISAACRTVDWDPASVWTQRTILSMGRSICEFWQRNGFDPLELASRWLTRDQFLRQEPGLILHGEAQPADRTDAWDRLPSGAQHPHKAALKRMLTEAILAAAGVTPLPPAGALTMADITVILDAISDLSDRVDQDHIDTRRYVPTRAVKVKGEPAQYLIVAGPNGGLARQHLSGELKDVLLKARVLSDIGREASFDFVELSDPGEVAAFLALPQV